MSRVSHILYLPCEQITKKSLKTPKGQSESVYRRRTDNTMAKKKKDKQRSTKHTYKTEDRVARTPLKLILFRPLGVPSPKFFF
jgi:hypothetical protein